MRIKKKRFGVFVSSSSSLCITDTYTPHSELMDLVMYVMDHTDIGLNFTNVILVGSDVYLDVVQEEIRTSDFYRSGLNE